MERVQGPQAAGRGIRMILTGTGAAALLAALHAGCFAGNARWDEPAMAALLAMPGCFAVADPDGLALARVAADEAELLTVGVLPRARRRGVGCAGLVEVGRRRRYYPDGDDALVLALSLLSAA